MSTSKNTREQAAAEPWAKFCDLPFVGEADGHAPHWTLPAAGGYAGGCWAGEAAAHAYLMYLQNKENDGGGTLQLVALSFAERLAAAESDQERAALRGQAVTFFATVGRAAAWFARNAMKKDPWTRQEIEDAIASGVNLDEAAHMREYERKWRSAAAKRGWASRRKAARRARRDAA